MGQTYPLPITAADVTRAYVRTITFVGGAVGDDVSVATSASTDAYSPKTQAEKASLMVPVASLAEDITRPRGWLEADDPYAAKPATPTGDPTITSLSPNTAVSVTGPDVLVTITGTNFTVWSTVTSGNFPVPAVYVSPTKLTILQKPSKSVAGTVQVKVTDHGVTSAPSNFVFT